MAAAQVEVTPAVHFDVSPPLRDITPVGPTPKNRADRTSKPRIPDSRRAAMNPSTQGVPDSRVASQGAPLAMPAAESFDGMRNPNGYYPPDTVGDVGPNHYVQMVNASFSVFDKDGTLLYGPADFSTLFEGFGGACEYLNDGDPIALYDQFADRWVLSQFALPAEPEQQLECVAVSVSGDPMGQYYRYAFGYGRLMPDYPKMSVWPDGYYATYNLFDPGNNWNFAGVQACALERRAMLVGAPASQQCYFLSNEFSLLPSDADGETPPPTGSPAYFLGEHWSDADKVTLYRMRTDWDSPSRTTLEGPVAIGVQPFTWACVAVYRSQCVPQPPVSDGPIARPLEITTPALPAAVWGSSYSTGLIARGGAPSYAWAVSQGELPEGWTLDSDTGVVSASATEATSDTSVTITATDSATPPVTVSREFTVTTVGADAVAITTSSVLPDGMAGYDTPYSVDLTASGGTPPYTWTVVDGLLPASLELDETGELSGVLSTDGTTTFTVRVSDASATPLEASAELTLSVDPPITAPLLESLGGHAMYRLSYRNFGTHESLVTSHTVSMDGTMGQPRQTGTGWWEFRSPQSDTVVFQEGVAASTDPNTFQWMGSAAMDRQGNLALGYSSSSTTRYPSVHYRGRLVTDAPGTLPYADGTIIAGTGSQWGLAARWGDYSSMTVDPVDDCTFWYTNQYLTQSSRNDWSTRIASFRFPQCQGSSTVPGAPSSPSARAADSAATVAWQPGATGGMPVVGYTVTASPGGESCSTLVGVTTDPLTCQVTGLSNGTTYRFAVVARNALGTGSSAETRALTLPGGGGGGGSSEPEVVQPTPSPTATKPAPGPGPDPGPPVAEPLAPVLTTAQQPPVVDGGERVRVRALHLTPGCAVDVRLGDRTRVGRVNEVGVAAVTLRAPERPGRYVIRAAVRASGSCASVLLKAPLRVRR